MVTITIITSSKKRTHYVCNAKQAVYCHDRRNLVGLSRERGNYKEVRNFYFETFASYKSICETFKRDVHNSGAQIDDTGLNMHLVYTVHDAIRQLVSPLFV